MSRYSTGRMAIRFQVCTNSCAVSWITALGSRASSALRAPSVTELRCSRPPVGAICELEGVLAVRRAAAEQRDGLAHHRLNSRHEPKRVEGGRVGERPIDD